MDILTYDDAHLRFRERLRRFCETEITPFVDQWETDRLVPRDIWRRMGAEGFLCPSVGPEYGGIGGDFCYNLIVCEELSRTAQTGLAAGLHSDVVVPYLEAFGTAAQKEKYLPGCVSGEIVTAIAMTEPDAGSDLAGMKTTAVESGDTVVVNGAKTFISNGIHCDLVVLAAGDPDVKNRHRAISLYLVEAKTPGFRKGNRLDKMGWHSQDTAELFFTDCRIPVANRLGEKGMGFLMLMQKLQQERLTCAMAAVVAAERILEHTLAACKGATADGRPLTRSQAVRFALVEMATEVRIGRTFLDTLIHDHMGKKDLVIETSMAKYWSTDLANRIANRAVDLLGPFGIDENNPFSRALRDCRVMAIFAGTNEIMKGIVAKFMGL